MSNDAYLTPSPRGALPETDAPDPRVARAEERLAILRELGRVLN